MRFNKSSKSSFRHFVGGNPSPGVILQNYLSLSQLVEGSAPAPLDLNLHLVVLSSCRRIVSISWSPFRSLRQSCLHEPSHGSKLNINSTSRSCTSCACLTL
ncbi:hypothetical protein AVEN_123795-1 [Araneus ventricosus]|uniref:Uncharacterized protein n=1 Tax=Araneus ventricosus TaxID=182803 RepID=A0A4Y2BKZ4_ARAVE|nr:hypothetical protein AVEN_123795-1 [Araneus ventricosus]